MHKFVNTINLKQNQTSNLMTTISYHSIQLDDAYLPFGFGGGSQYYYYTIQDVNLIEYN